MRLLRTLLRVIYSITPGTTRKTNNMAAAHTPKKMCTSNGRKNTPGKAQGASKTPQKDIFKKVQEPPFEEYWPKSEVSAGLKKGTLLQGIFRVSANDFNKAYISDPMSGPDYIVQGAWPRNRAMDGDEVAFFVLPPNEWLYKEADEKALTIKDLNLESNSDEIPPVVPTDEKTADNKTDQPTLIDALYGNSKPVGVAKPILIDNGKLLNMYTRTAKVVYIIEASGRRAAAGYFKTFNKSLGLALFSPRDSRQPRTVIPLSCLPDDYTSNHKKYEKSLFICRIKDWKVTDPFPTGELLRSIGEAGDIKPETESILTEYDIDSEEFPAAITESLPLTDGQWIIPQEEIAKRKDFREDCVFTIDPSTARDLDDAIHCKSLSNGVFELGVHIADVSYFLRPGTPLDRMASERATSVYLIQNVIPMLPRILCEELCSLNPQQDRLTFSVVWKLTDKGELLDEWMGRSVIHSKAKLSYEEAQKMVDDPQFPWKHSDFPCIPVTEAISDIVESVNRLNKITKRLRLLRQARGSLRLDQPKLVFNIDSSTGLPNGCHIYQHKESNKMIEECMLLANMAVAHKISETYPELALLRRHPPPKGKAIEHLRDQFKLLGVQFDCSTSADIQKSLNRYISKGKEGDKKLEMEKLVLVSLCCRAMELAQYFCTAVYKEDQFRHYALNVPRYTHFTSPIRRYPDIIVHRLLAAALGEGDAPKYLPQDIEDIANHCNKKRKNAKTAEELSSGLFLGLFIRECGPVDQEGIVCAVLDKSFDVLLPELGMIKRIYCQRLSLDSYKYELLKDKGCESPQLQLIWSSENKDTPPIMQLIKVFNPVKVLLSSFKNSLQFEATLVQERSHE